MAVQDVVNSAELKLANLILANGNALTAGALSVNWQLIIKANRGILCVQNQVNVGDTSSPNFLSAYACLQNFVGQYAGGAIDPNAQNPNTIINVTTPGFEPTVLDFTQANLVSDGQGGYYLPIIGGDGLVIVSVTSNGIGVEGLIPDYTVSPPKLYNFANNSNQAIIVTLI